MLSASRRAVVANLLSSAAVVIGGSSWARAADEQKEKPLSPEVILEKKFEGQATVELEVGEVHTLNIDSLFVPDVSHDQIIKAKIPGAKTGQEFLVIVKRDVATRLLKLGIEDPAEHFRGKLLRVSGRVVRRSETQFQLRVTSLDQLEHLRKP